MRVTKDPETRREDILKAALELFREDGFEKVSVESIARKAEIAKGSFYNYFKSKEDVFGAVISLISSRTLPTAKEIISDKKASPKERLQRYVDWTYSLAQQQEKSLSRVLSPDASSSQREMYLRALDEGISQMLPLFAALLEEGASSLEFDIADSQFTAVVMLGAFRGLHVAFYDNLQIEMDRSKIHLLDLLSRLLGAIF